MRLNQLSVDSHANTVEQYRSERGYKTLSKARARKTLVKKVTENQSVLSEVRKSFLDRGETASGMTV